MEQLRLKFISLSNYNNFTVTIISLFLIVWCQHLPTLSLPIPLNDRRKIQNLNTNKLTICNDSIDGQIYGGGVAALSSYPPEGTGLFKDPLDVLGPKFPRSSVIYLCQLHLYMYADVISHVEFTDKGSKMCVEVCDQYHKNIVFNGIGDVSLMQGYCDYTGVTEQRGDYNDLSTTCTCAYKIRCNSRTKVIMYTFQTNCAGFLRVSVTDSNHTQCITR